MLPVGTWESRAEGQIPLTLLPSMQPGIQPAFWAGSSHCWLTLCLPSTNTPKPFSSGQLSVPGAALTQALCLALLSSVMLAHAHLCSLPSSARRPFLCRVAAPLCLLSLQIAEGASDPSVSPAEEFSDTDGSSEHSPPQVLPWAGQSTSASTG